MDILNILLSTLIPILFWGYILTCIVKYLIKYAIDYYFEKLRDFKNVFKD